jgi:hypothetical protein
LHDVEPTPRLLLARKHPRRIITPGTFASTSLEIDWSPSDFPGEALLQGAPNFSKDRLTPNSLGLAIATSFYPERDIAWVPGKEQFVRLWDQRPLDLETNFLVTTRGLIALME